MGRVKKRGFWEIVRRFLEPAMKKPWSFINITFFNATVSFLMVALIYGTQYIVNSLEIGDKEEFMFWVYVLLGISLLSFLVKVLRKPYIFILIRDGGKYIDEIYMPRVIYGDNNMYEKIGTGRMIAIFGKGIAVWIESYWRIFGDFVGSLVTFVSFLVSLYIKDVYLFSGMVFSLFFVFLRFRLVGKYPYKRRKLAKKAFVLIKRLQVKWFMAKQEIMQQNRIFDELKIRDKYNTEWYVAKHKEKILQGIVFDGAVLIATLSFVGIIFFSGKRVLTGSFSYADLVVIVGLGSTFLNELSGLLRKIRVFIDKWIDIDQMRDLVDDLQSDIDITIGEKINITHGDIHLNNISFSYDKKCHGRVFNNFSLFIEGGQKTALVGPSGGGKSTLVKLIAGYLRPDKGSVVIDGQDLQKVSLKSYYQHVGYLTQEPNVFDGTIRENLLYGFTKRSKYNSSSSRDVIQKKIVNAIKDAKCEFIYDFPNGLDTEIGERGVRLSGGQRQRLAIAKILLKDPEIIILDEPTSALDSESEEAITKAMNTLFEGRTVIIIAHRLQTVKHADEIIFIEFGEVTEQGTHEELIAKKGKYWKMVELQSGF